MDKWVLNLLKNYKRLRKINLSSSWLKCKNINKRFDFCYQKSNEAFLELADGDMSFAKRTIVWLKDRINKNNLEVDGLGEGLLYLKTHNLRSDTRKTYLIIAVALLGLIGVLVKNDRISAGSADTLAMASLIILGILFVAERAQIHNHKSAVLELIAFLEFIIAELKDNEIEKDKRSVL